MCVCVCVCVHKAKYNTVIGLDFIGAQQRFSIEDIITVFVALLTEQKVLIRSSSYASLTSTAEALLALLHPFR